MRPDDDDDRPLVAALVARRDPSAFGALYERHGAYLYRLALRLTAGDASAAEDVVHDAWLRAVPRLAGFEWRSRLRTWLAAFVINGARERFRDADRELPLTEQTSEHDTGPLRGAMDRVDLERALRTLPPKQRHVLLLHDAEGYTHEEIAELLAIDPGTSKSQLSRARAAMRRALGSP